MFWIAFKYMVTAGVVVLVSEIARHSDRLGAFVASLPLVTVLVLIWMYIDNQSIDKISTLNIFDVFLKLLKVY